MLLASNILPYTTPTSPTPPVTDQFAPPVVVIVAQGVIARVMEQRVAEPQHIRVAPKWNS